MLKTCSKCKKEKEEDQFHKNQHKCIICSKEYYEENKEKICKYRKEYRIKHIEKLLLKKAQYRALYKGIQIDLTIEDIKEIMPKDNICPLLLIPLFVENKHSRSNSFSLDRIDSNKGYVKDNVRIISIKANRSKSNSTINEYEEIISNLENLKIKETKKSMSVIRFLMTAKKRSKKYNVAFNLDGDYLRSIYPEDNRCPLLGIKFKKGNGRAIATSPTLDRIIPELGYIKGNVCFVSHKANTIKNNLSLDEMKLLLANWKKMLEPKSSI